MPAELHPPILATLEVLDRQDQRRRNGLPTISFLAGPIGLGLKQWRDWATARQRPLLVLDTTDPASVEWAIAETILASPALWDQVIHSLECWTGIPAESLASEFDGMTLFDLQQFWNRVPAAGPSAIAARRLLERKILAGPFHAREILEPSSDSLANSSTEMLAGLSSLFDADLLPAMVCLNQPADTFPPHWLQQLMPTAAKLAEMIPSLPIAIVSEWETIRAVMSLTLPSRLRSLFEEGLLQTPQVDRKAIENELTSNHLSATKFAEPLERLCRDGASPEVACAWQEAAVSCEQSCRTGEMGAARSKAEWFLFLRLESLAETAGKFELNGKLDFRFGNAAAEIDLLGRELKVALEVDGVFHFQNLDSYRRDRRKDWELQRRGFLVLRFLAEDVVEQLDDVLDRILAAVRQRQGVISATSSS